MKERPILFSAPMVRAILDGSKTQTRRIVKLNPLIEFDLYEGGLFFVSNSRLGIAPKSTPCVVGDLLWVKETWRVRGKHTDAYKPVEIAANRAHFEIAYQADVAWNDDIYGKVRPSIFMPRSLSRISLEVTDVRAERLQTISEQDAEAEGVRSWAASACAKGNPRELTAVGFYQVLWGAINGPDSWHKNPWVWVISFKRIP